MFIILLFCVVVLLLFNNYRHYKINYQNNLFPLKYNVTLNHVNIFLKQFNVLYRYNPPQYIHFSQNVQEFFKTYNNRNKNIVNAYNIMDNYKQNAIECLYSITYSMNKNEEIQNVIDNINKLTSIFDMYLNEINHKNNKNIVKPFNSFDIDPHCAIFVSHNTQ